ncbi:MAG: helix-turn-helix transcriptional regulator [Cyanobacteriota bacterium]
MNSWLPRVRERFNVTQRQVGLTLGITDQAVSNWERREVEPRLTYSQWKLLCKLLGCSFEELGKLIAQVENPAQEDRSRE